MSKKKLIFLTIFFMTISLLAFLSIPKNEEIFIDFSDPAYSYLPESAQNFISEEAKKGNKVLTEKNKEPKKVYLNPKYVEYLELPAEKKSQLEVIPSIYTYDYVITSSPSEELPSSYVIPNLHVKNQGSLGICWAFAAISSIETNILQTGLSTTPVYFSERQMDYVMTDMLTETSNPYAINNIKDKIGTILENHNLGEGATYIDLYLYWNMGISPVEEDVWGPYDTSRYNTRSISEVLNYDNVSYQVSGYNMYGNNKYNDSELYYYEQVAFLNEIKSHIMNYGSLYIATITPNEKAGPCYDYEKNLLNYNSLDPACGDGTNIHAMSIVGWNDEHEVWILKNSWGDNLPFVYMSYESDFYDVLGVTLVEPKNWDNGYNATSKHTSNYNSQNYEITYYKSSEFAESLDKINFVSWGIDADYKVYYKTEGESYQLIATVHKDLPGLVTVNVDSIILNDDSFTIKVTTSNGNIDEGINAFTTNLTSEEYSEVYEFSKKNEIEKQLIVRNIQSGSLVNYYVFDEFGQKIKSSNAYVINGIVDVKTNFNICPTDYQLTMDKKACYRNKVIDVEEPAVPHISISLDCSSGVCQEVEEIDYYHCSGVLSGDEEKVCKTQITVYEEIDIPDTKYYLTLDKDLFYVNTADKVELNVGNFYQILYEASEYLNIKSVSYVSENPDILAVTDTGVVTALKAGKAIVNLNINDNIVIPIEFTLVKNINVQSIDIIESDSSIYLNLENQINLHLNVNPSVYLIDEVNWSSSNEEVATVENGLVTFLSEGTVTITASLEEKSDTVTFEVINSPSEVLLSADKTNIAVLEEITITSSTNPSDYYWESSNPEVATVNDGIVTGVKNGFAWIYYRYDSEIAGIKINVIDEENKINLNIDPNGGKYGDSLEIVVIPGNYLETKTLDEPNYEVKITLINEDNTEIKTLSHEFLKYNLNGGGLLDNLTYTFDYFDGNITAIWKYNSYTLPVLEKENKVFTGWYFDAELTDYFGSDLTFIPMEDVTLYAGFSIIKLGDVNEDGVVDITDLVLLRVYLAYENQNNLSNLLNADLNRDNIIDITDLVILRRYLAGLEEIE